MLSIFSSSSLATSSKRILPTLTATATRRFLSTSLRHREMYRHQADLPRLPVPSLNETLEKYLKSVKPLLGEKELIRTTQAVDHFLKPEGPGNVLQTRLLERAEKKDNWLAEWWNDLAYFSYREPIVVNVSYFYLYQDDRRCRNRPTRRAAEIIQAAREFRDLVAAETLPVEMAKAEPLCMDSYKWMFNACRIPQKPSDYEKKYDHATNQHVAVVRKNKFYTFDVLKPDGKPLSTTEVEKQLEWIVDDAGELPGPAVGLLTTQHRDTWTDHRSSLLALKGNAQVLEKLESAMFLVCLDDTGPVTREQASFECWVGEGKNRYFDKSLQFIVFENGKAGFNGEHSSMDGMPTLNLNNFVCERLAKGSYANDCTAAGQLTPPQPQIFQLSHDLLRAIQNAEQDLKKLTHAHDLRVVAYSRYGAHRIKEMKASPDAFVQLAIQLAYYKKNHKPCATYESAQTRRFLKGRTEVCRSCSVESLEWCQAMEDHSVSVETKAELGRRAIDAHTQYMQDAIRGKGCDRHLLGLRLLLKPDEPIPALFTDPAYSRSSHWKLSTSQLTSEHFDGYGWGEVVPDGYGIAYMIKNHQVQFNVVALKEMKVDEMAVWLEEAMNDMAVVFGNSTGAVEGVGRINKL